MSAIIKIKILIFHMSISYLLVMLEGKSIDSNNIHVINDHQNHTEQSIADQVEIIYPNLHQSLPTKQPTRLKKDPKFLSEQVEVFSNKKQTYKSIPGLMDDGKAIDDGKPLKFVSSRPLFVHRNEQRKKQQQQQHQQHYGNEIVYTDKDHSYPYPYPFSYYTSHGVFHYFPYGRY